MIIWEQGIFLKRPDINGDCSFIPGCPDLNNCTKAILITTLFGLLAQASYQQTLTS